LRNGWIEAKLDRESAMREKLEREISDLKQRAMALQSRIDEMEDRLKTLP
jgi:predicted  nucleic acid-binding Zn-ribbon protein